MLKLKVFSAAALLALTPMFVTTSAEAQFRGRESARIGGGAGIAARPAIPSPRWGAAGGAAFAGRPAGIAGPRFNPGIAAARPGGWAGRPGGWQGRRIGAGIGFATGLAAGAALASRPYYGGYGYGYGPGYYGYTDPGYVVDNGYADNGYVDDEPVVAVPSASGGDSDDAYCRQRYRSYDPRTGTYLNNDGNRYPCP